MFKNNKIYRINPDGTKSRIFFVPGLSIKFTGKNNEVNIGYPYARFMFSKIKCGENCKVNIGSSTNRVKNLRIFADAENAVCEIGENFHCTNGCEITVRHEDNLKVTIGNDCMFGKNIEIRVSDAHTIFDNTTGEILNKGQDIVIGSHCWFGHNVTILKGVNIARDCVIAMNSVISKDCNQSNSIYAGIPAKQVKQNINWRK